MEPKTKAMLRLVVGLWWSAAVFLATASVAAEPQDRPSTLGAKAQFGQAISMIAAGNGQASLHVLRAIDPNDLSGTAQQARACMLKRLADPTPPTDATIGPSDLAQATVAAYRQYWMAVLIRAQDPTSAREQLTRHLAALVGLPTDAGASTVETALSDALHKQGFHAHFGRTPPLDELILWQSQQIHPVTVQLPEQSQSSRIVALNGVVSHGWSDYATCGLAGTGGWAENDAVYAIVDHFPSGLDDNAFQASLLAHESQHMADYAKFGTLPGWRLEYRAKLSELWRSDAGNMAKLLIMFKMAQSDDPALPHPYANRRLMTLLTQELGSDPAGADPDAVRAAAIELLKRDSDTPATP